MEEPYTFPPVMMNAEQTAKIESAVAGLLEECRAKDRPYTRVLEFVAALQEDPN